MKMGILCVVVQMAQLGLVSSLSGFCHLREKLDRSYRSEDLHLPNEAP